MATAQDLKFAYENDKLAQEVGLTNVTFVEDSVNTMEREWQKEYSEWTEEEKEIFWNGMEDVPELA